MNLCSAGDDVTGPKGVIGPTGAQGQSEVSAEVAVNLHKNYNYTAWKINDQQGLQMTI